MSVSIVVTITQSAMPKVFGRHNQITKIMSNQIKIIDPHIHLWDPYTTPKLVSPLVKTFGRFPWLLDKVGRLLFPKASITFVGDPQYVFSPHLPEIFHRDTGKYKIDGYVHIQAGWEGEKPFNGIGETEWLMTLKDKPLAIIGEAHLHDLENLDAVLDAHAKASPLFKGVRDMLAVHPNKLVMDFNETGDMLKSADFKKGYARLGERNLTYDAYLFSHQLKDFTQLVSDVPDTKVVLDHVGTPIGVGGDYVGIGKTAKEREQIQAGWYEDLARLAAVPHVKLKLSGLLMTLCGFQFEKLDRPASLNEVMDAIAPHIEYALNTFGVDRCMFASNFPMDKVSTTYETLYDAYFKIVENYAIEDKRKLFAENALAFYGI